MYFSTLTGGFGCARAGVTVAIVLCGLFARGQEKTLFGEAGPAHVGFDDRPRLAEKATTEEEAVSHYKRVRGEICAFVETLPEALNS